jgi:hypothetical protein
MAGEKQRGSGPEASRRRRGASWKAGVPSSMPQQRASASRPCLHSTGEPSRLEEASAYCAWHMTNRRVVTRPESQFLNPRNSGLKNIGSWVSRADLTPQRPPLLSCPSTSMRRAGRCISAACPCMCWQEEGAKRRPQLKPSSMTRQSGLFIDADNTATRMCPHRKNIRPLVPLTFLSLRGYEDHAVSLWCSRSNIAPEDFMSTTLHTFRQPYSTFV